MIKVSAMKLTHETNYTVLIATFILVVTIGTMLFMWQEDSHRTELQYNELVLLMSMHEHCYGSYTLVVADAKMVCQETTKQSGQRVADIRKHREALAQRVDY